MVIVRRKCRSLVGWDADNERALRSRGSGFGRSQRPIGLARGQQHSGTADVHDVIYDQSLQPHSRESSSHRRHRRFCGYAQCGSQLRHGDRRIHLCSITVTNSAPATLLSIAVTPGNPSIVNGTAVQLTATGTYSDSSTRDLTTQVVWSSSDSTKATVSPTGLVTAVATGSTTLTATSGNISGSTQATYSAVHAVT